MSIKIYETELTDRQQARRILDLSDEYELRATRYADPAMWTRRTQEYITSSAEVFGQNGCFIRRGDNERLGGKRKVDRLLNNLEDGQPGLLIFETCPNLIKQLSQLVYDANHDEDVNTRMEDHAYDALRYMLTTIRDYKKSAPARIQKSPFLSLDRI